MVDYIVNVKQPFNMIETHDFSITTQRNLNPQSRGWFRNTIKRDIMKRYHTQRENFKTFFFKFEGKICLTSDIWISLTHTGFLCITAHYIDSECKLNKRIILFKTISSLHSGKNIATLINDEIIDLDIFMIKYLQ